MANYTMPIDPLQEWIRKMLQDSMVQNVNAEASYAGPMAGLLQDTHVPGYEESKWGKQSSGPTTPSSAPKTAAKAEKGSTAQPVAAPAQATTAPAQPAAEGQPMPEGYQGITPEVEERIRKKARWNLMAGVSPTATVSAALAVEEAKKRDYEDKMFAATLQKYGDVNVADPQVQRKLAMDMISTGGDKGLQYGTQILTNLNTQQRMRENVHIQASKQLDMANLYGRNLQIMKEQPGTPAAQQAYYQNEGLRALWKTDEYTLANRAMTNPQMIGMQTFMPEVAETAAGMRGEFDPSTKLRQGSGPPRAPSDMRLDTPEQTSLSSEKPSDWRVARKALIDSKRYSMDQIDKILRREYPDYPGVK